MRRPNELVRAVVWLTERMLLRGLDIVHAQLWILPQELAQLSRCRGDALERDEAGVPIRLCGMRLRVLGLPQPLTKSRPGA